jgi:hypothetical protein
VIYSVSLGSDRPLGLHFCCFENCLSMCAIAGSVILLGLKVQPAAFLLIVAHPSSHTCHIMLDKRPSVLKVNHMFVPWPLKPVQFDKQNVKLYPVIDLTMKPLKHAHSFQINKTVLAALGINRSALLNTLGTQLNLSTIVNDVLGNWNRHFLSQLVLLFQPKDPFVS